MESNQNTEIFNFLVSIGFEVSEATTLAKTLKEMGYRTLRRLTLAAPSEAQWDKHQVTIADRNLISKSLEEQTTEPPSKRRYIEPPPRRPSIHINGKVLSTVYKEFVLPSSDAKSIINRIRKDENSAAFYLAGPYTTGKTNTLYQLCAELRKLDFNTVLIDADIRSGTDKWNLIERELRKINFVQEYVTASKSYDSFDIKQKIGTCCDAFNSQMNEKVLKYDDKIVICVDEAQSYESLNFDLWTQTIRQLTRKRHKVWVVCATSSYNFFLPRDDIDISPFDEEFFTTTYFSEEMLKEGLKQLEGEKNEDYYVDFSRWEDDIVNLIMRETEGHPYLSANYFLVVSDLMDRVNSSSYKLSIDDVGKEWKFANMYVYQKLAQSRLRKKISQCVPQLKNYVENSGLLYGNSIPFEKTLDWHLTSLRLGLTKLNGNILTMSCNLIRVFYLQSIQPILPPIHSIVNLCTPSYDVKILELVEVLFSHLPSTPFLKKESWVTDRIKPSQLGPSEKLYQTEFFSILSSICNDPCWYPLYEMNRGGANKVDLGLVCSVTKKKYLIKLGVNCPNTGQENSCQLHYDRQYSQYHTKDVQGSIVIMIYTNEHPFYFPPTLYPEVQYLAVGHYTINPKRVVLQQKGEKKKQILLKF
eukprot:TRINITY_DN5189_c0_g1_i2.p1 TRINITY_DN5189_c0_g1~~TRINITY_DN5189_c0_g1_i2.p1  ORF type:complete len:642 (+),score=85.50 TRINITY_DN5189_c0_g1_i2:81-2006(+)